MSWKNRHFRVTQIRDTTKKNKILTWWWLNQPIWKIWVKLDPFPRDRDENKKYLSCHQLVNLSPLVDYVFVGIYNQQFWGTIFNNLWLPGWSSTGLVFWLTTWLLISYWKGQLQTPKKNMMLVSRSLDPAHCQIDLGKLIRNKQTIQNSNNIWTKMKGQWFCNTLSRKHLSIHLDDISVAEWNVLFYLGG